MTHLANRDNLYRDLFDFRRDFDHIFHRLVNGGPIRPQRESDLSSQAMVPAVNAYIDRNTKQFHCDVALPGIDPQDIQIQVQRNLLSVRGRHEREDERDESDVVYREWMFDSFEREIPLPEGIDPDKLSAEYRNGTLEITAPVSATSLAKRVEIKGAREMKQMSAAGR